MNRSDNPAVPHSIAGLPAWAIKEVFRAGAGPRRDFILLSHIDDLAPGCHTSQVMIELADLNPVQTYFRNIRDTIQSIVIGMKITLKYCFQKTVVVQYPEQRLNLAPRYRGIHEFEANKCIACDLCAKACPVDCIYIDKTAPRRIDKATGLIDLNDPKNGKLVRFAIDYSKCLFCALCTEPCPTDCIHMGKLHDLSSYSREDVVVEFAELDKQNLRTPLPLWMERNAAKIPWVKAEMDRVKSGTLATDAADIPTIK